MSLSNLPSADLMRTAEKVSDKENIVTPVQWIDVSMNVSPSLSNPSLATSTQKVCQSPVKITQGCQTDLSMQGLAVSQKSLGAAHRKAKVKIKKLRVCK